MSASKLSLPEQFPFMAPPWRCIERLAGVSLARNQDFEWFVNTPECLPLPVGLYRVWTHTVAPVRSHTTCMQEHQITTMTIPAAEAQFMRGSHLGAYLTPSAMAGPLTIRACPKQGTRLRVELMDLIFDTEVSGLARHYQVLTGPTIGGLLVTFMMRGPTSCKAVTFEFTRTPNYEIHARVTEHDMPEHLLPAVQIPPNENQGLLVTRHTWLGADPEHQRAYGLMQDIFQQWVSTTTIQNRGLFTRAYAAQPEKAERITPYSEPTSFATTTRHADILAAVLTEFADPARVTSAFDALVKYRVDNPWLTSTYIGLPSRATPPVLVRALTLEVGTYQFLNDRMTWSLQNDPVRDSLIKAALHERIHRVTWAIQVGIAKADQSSPVNYDEGIPMMGKGFNTRVQQSWYPVDMTPLTEDGRSQRSVSIASTHFKPNEAFGPMTRRAWWDSGPKPQRGPYSLSSESDAVFSEHAPRVWQPRRERRSRRTYQAAPQDVQWGEDAPSKREQPRQPEQSNWQRERPSRSPRANWSNDRRPTNSPRRQERNDGAPATDPPLTWLEQAMLRPLTQHEAKLAAMNIPCPGRMPLEECIEPLALQAFIKDNHLDTEKVLTFALAQSHGLWWTQLKQQREICYLNQRLSDAKIPRPKHQYNAGRLPDDTGDFSTRLTNANPFNARMDTGNLPQHIRSSRQALVW